MLKNLSCWDQFLAMAFAQLTYRESLRDIEACLRAVRRKLYHVGFRGRAGAQHAGRRQRVHDWRIYADFAQVLIGIARPLYANDPLGIDLRPDPVCARLDDHRPVPDSVSVGPIPQAQGRGQVAHTARPARQHPDLYPHFPRENARCQRPRRLPAEAGAFYVMDRGYVDFQRLYRFTLGVGLLRGAHQTNVLLQRRSRAPSTRPPACAAIRPSSWRG